MSYHRTLLLGFLWSLLLCYPLHAEVQYLPPPTKQKPSVLKKRQHLRPMQQQPPMPPISPLPTYELSPLLFLVLLSMAGIGLVLLLSGIFAGISWLWMLGGILTSLGSLSFLAIWIGGWLDNRPSARVRADQRAMRRQERLEEYAWRKKNHVYQKAVGRFFTTFGITVGILGLMVLPFFIGFFWAGIVWIGAVLAVLLGVLIYVFIIGDLGLSLMAVIGGFLMTLGIGGLIYGLILQWAWMWILGSILIAIPLLGIAAIAFSLAN